MSLEEYERIISRQMVRAYNGKDRRALIDTFTQADQVLQNSNIDPEQRKKFWNDVYEIFIHSNLLLEKQANSALLALMQTIEREIEARTGKKTGTSK